VITYVLMKRLLLALVLCCSALASAQERIQDLIYHKAGGTAFTLDVFKPAKPTGAVVIWIVSGGWVSTHEAINPGLASAYNDQGFTVVQAVHGAQPKYTVPEILVQLRQAIRFVRTNASKFGYDANRIGVSGASAGGHLSLMLAATPALAEPESKNPINRVGSEVQAVVAYFPPTDFLNWGKEGALASENRQLSIFMPALGVTPTTTKERLLEIGKQLSPISYVKSSLPPTFLIHGDKDALVPVQQSQSLDAALAKVGAVHDLMVIPGSGHDGTVMAPSAARVFAWFSRHLAKK
jgi:acetyl esterase/lipase